jgi:hypothetical protein
MPSGLVLLHLWTLGYIHTLDFMPAFLAPFLLGLAVTATSAQLHRQLLLPGIAALCSLGGDPVVTLQLFGDTHAFSPLRCALVGAGIVWVYLGRRDRRPRLVFMGICATAVGLLGSSTRRLAQALRRLFEKALPADAFGWGVLTVVAAFALLAAGVRRSLQGEPRWPGRAPGLKARSRLGESDAASTGGGQ